MSIRKIEAKALLKSFQAQIEHMAWGAVGQIIDAQRNKLSIGLVEAAAKAWKSRGHKNTISSKAKKAESLSKKLGTWDRGGGKYKVLGPGKKPNTYDLRHIKTGRVINATAKTLLARWKHFA